VKIDSPSNANVKAPKDGPPASHQGDAANALAPEPAAAGAGAGAAAQAAGNASGDANVNLSALSSQLRTVSGAVASSGAADIDTAHVESIRQAIKDGTLSIDPGKIADGVLETARGLLQQKPSSGS
jgi:negative regulator of flagellin synthesis FlgM